jgi:hypothetical protein
VFRFIYIKLILLALLFSVSYSQRIRFYPSADSVFISSGDYKPMVYCTLSNDGHYTDTIRLHKGINTQIYYYDSLKNIRYLDDCYFTVTDSTRQNRYTLCLISKIYWDDFVYQMPFDSMVECLYEQLPVYLALAINAPGKTVELAFQKIKIISKKYDESLFNIRIEKGDEYANKDTIIKISADTAKLIKLSAADRLGNIISDFNTYKNYDGGDGFINLKLKGIFHPPANESQKIILRNSNGDTLYRNSNNLYQLPVKYFKNGFAEIFLKDTKSEDTLRLSIPFEDNKTIKLKSGDGAYERLFNMGDSTIRYFINPGWFTGFDLSVTPRRGNKVFIYKAMEIIVTPVDKYFNEIKILNPPVELFRFSEPADGINWPSPAGPIILFQKTYSYLTPIQVHETPGADVLKFGVAAILDGWIDSKTRKTVDVLVAPHIPIPPDTSTFSIKEENELKEIKNNTIHVNEAGKNYRFKWGAGKDTNDKPLVKSWNKDYIIPDQCKIKYRLKIDEYPGFTFQDSTTYDTSITLSEDQIKDIFLHTRKGNAKQSIIHWFIAVDDGTYWYTMPYYKEILSSKRKSLILTDDSINIISGKIRFYPYSDTVYIKSGCTVPRLLCLLKRGTNYRDSIGFLVNGGAAEAWYYDSLKTSHSIAEFHFTIIDSLKQNEYELYLYSDSSGKEMKVSIPLDSSVNWMHYSKSSWLTLYVKRAGVIYDSLIQNFRIEETGIKAEPLNNDFIYAKEISLLNNYPNPFNPSTKIPVEISREMDIKLSIFDLNGREVRLIYSGKLSKGIHSFEWDGRDNDGRNLSAGVYFTSLRTKNGNRISGKMLMIK